MRNLVAELPVPLIAFAGAPFTVASYLLEGRPSRTYVRTKALMHTDEALWFDLMDLLADLAIDSLRSQVDQGASALQLFDSWAGALSPQDYERFVLPASTKVLSAVADSGVPRIHFGVNTSELLGLIASAGAEVVGVDWRTPLDAARERVPEHGGCRATWTPPSSPPDGTPPSPPCSTCCAAAGATPAVGAGTCSTSATASCPRPTPRPSNVSSSWSTAEVRR